MIAYRLTFEDALRVGSAGEELPRSDTLHAALCTALAALGEDAGAAAAEPPFALSSMFPWVRRRTGEIVSFVPCPLGAPIARLWPATSEPSPEAVAWSALGASAPRFLSFGLLPRLFGAAPATAAPFITQDGEAWSDAPVGAHLWAHEARARLPLDRASGRGRGLVRERWLRFVQGAGLYFLAEPRDARARALLDAALAYLGDEGLGRRAPFTFEVDEAFHAPTGGDAAYLLLSLYLPSEAETRAGVLRGGRYALVRRGGVHASGAARAAVDMVAEGALLQRAALGARGASIVVGQADGHAIHRSGRALGVPVPGGPST